jgi:hypothetical protein
MGTVHLTNGHHGLYISHDKVDLSSRVVLDAELLARPILNGQQPLVRPTQHVIRAALQGLMDLHGFDAAISYGVVEKEGVSHIQIPHRVWGEITLETPENVIVGFSHDTRYENSPYYNLLQWLEKKYPEDELSYEEFGRFCLEWSSTERWRKFFEARILQRAKALTSQAEHLMREVRHIVAQLKSIEATLG